MAKKNAKKKPALTPTNRLPRKKRATPANRREKVPLDGDAENTISKENGHAGKNQIPKSWPPMSSESVLGMRFISYATPLKVAQRWLQSGEREQQLEATKLLEGLFRRFGFSVEVGHVLVLAYLETREDRKAKLVLDKLALLCRNPHEEVQSRCGRLYRDQGDRYIKYPEIGGKQDSPVDALRFYRFALEEYEAAFEIRRGHYPGINVATLHFLIAALEAREANRRDHLARSRKIASELLEGKSDWPEESVGEDIWKAATEGEALLLLERWAEAKASYLKATENEHCQPFHVASMRKQLIRIVHCYKHRFQIRNLGPFKRWEEWFPQ